MLDKFIKQTIHSLILKNEEQKKRLQLGALHGKNHMKKVITILQASKGYEEYSKEIHSEINQLEKISFHKIIKAFYPDNVVAKSITEPENSNDLSVANTSTPFYYRAFFVRSIRTPKENALSVVLSMVACNGKGIALCCVPLIAVSQPVTRYRPNPEKFSGSPTSITYGAISDDLPIQSRKP